MNTRLIKRVAAIVLCISFFLPLSQCSRVDGDMKANPVPVNITAYSSYDWPNIGSSVAFVLFFWPIVVQGFAFFKSHRFKSRALLVAELGMCVLTVAGISWLVFWGSSVRFGAFVAYSGIIAYGIASWAEGKTSGTDHRF